MRLTEKVARLTPAQVKELHDVLVEAGLAYELTGQYADVFRRAKYRKVGMQRSIYQQLETIPAHTLPTIIAIITQ